MDHSQFAAAWESAWNSHDLNRIMTHYSDDVVFRSRKAIALTGTGEVRGHVDLRAYWAAALDQQPYLRFHVTHVFAGHDVLTINYTNHKGVIAAETLWFRSDGLVTQACACHAT